VSAAAKVLIVGGTLNLALAFAMGFVLSQARLRGPRESTLHLLQVHRVALWEGFMLLGLTFAVNLSPLSAAVNTLAAALLVASSLFQDASSILNWVQRVDDEFAQRSQGFSLAVINALLGSVGLAILIYGVFRGL